MLFLGNKNAIYPPLGMTIDKTSGFTGGHLLCTGEKYDLFVVPLQLFTRAVLI
jgi:hypothetical protein